MLEAASVVSEQFTVAAGVEGAAEEVEACCEMLALQHHFIVDTGLTVWPDGTRGGATGFNMRSTGRCCTKG